MCEILLQLCFKEVKEKFCPSHSQLKMVCSSSYYILKMTLSFPFSVQKAWPKICDMSSSYYSTGASGDNGAPQNASLL